MTTNGPGISGVFSEKLLVLKWVRWESDEYPSSIVVIRGKGREDGRGAGERRRKGGRERVSGDGRGETDKQQSSKHRPAQSKPKCSTS